MLELLQNNFVGVHELRVKLTDLVTSVKEKGKEIIITQQGKPVALLVNIEKYLEMKQAIQEFSNPQFMTELIEAKKEIEEGKGVIDEDVYAKKGI